MMLVTNSQTRQETRQLYLIVQRTTLARFLILIAIVPIFVLGPKEYSAKVNAQTCLQLAFSKQNYVDFQWHIFVTNADGSNERQLTNGDFLDNFPVWSPDGKHIAFLRVDFNKTDDLPHLYIMAPDGSGMKRLTEGIAFEFSPTWSPDSKKIAFISGSEDKSAVYIMNVDGSERTHVVDLSMKLHSSLVQDVLPAKPILRFAEDGHHLYYQREGIKVIDIDQKVLKSIEASGQSFEWSPNGKRIVYVDGRAGTPDIYVMDADGHNIVQLTTAGQEEFPTWSPDGHIIAFTSNRNGTSDFLSSDVYLMGADGSHLVRLTTDMKDYWSPQWSPDGHQLIFWSNLTHQTYIIDADGQRFHAITHLTDNESAQHFSWSPILC